MITVEGQNQKSTNIVVVVKFTNELLQEKVINFAKLNHEEALEGTSVCFTMVEWRFPS